MNQTNPFLKTLAEALFRDYGENIRDVCMVFPNRRAGLFFKKYLSAAAQKTIWSPQIFTISEFMQHLSPLQPADPVDLVFEVYEIYRKTTTQAESLDEFWHWGEMMLSDFDDIDKYLVDAASIYSNIRDLKEIDSHFDLTEEQKETIRKFWGFFMSGELSSQKESFLKIWNILFTVYSRLNKNLKEKGLGYEGMIYRGVAEEIKAGNYPEIPWDRVIICGFNALNKAERELFRYLGKSGQSRFFWDYDTYYLNDGVREAGRFMRINMEEFPPDTKLENFDNIHSRNVNIYELPSDITQAKYLNTLLQKEDSNDLLNFNHTALVLCDEDLLIPVLTSMPANIEDINITMGYPMSSTPVYSFTDMLLRMQKNIASHRGKRKDRFYFRDVLSILNHQYLKLAYEDKVLEKIKEINDKNLMYLDTVFFSESAILRLIFRKVEDTGTLADYIRDILLEVAGMISMEEKSLHSSLEKEYIFHLLTRLNKIKGIFGGKEQVPGIETFTRVFRKVLKNLRIPFEGEPLAGLQIMGILETRLLDFNNVIFLSMNDGVMPRSHQSFSYIPHNLRYAYGMPTREDQDAIYAYYFYRLVQRASNVSVFYNSRSDGLNSGEKSRYIYQMLYDPRFVTSFRSIGFNISGRDALPITVVKTPEILKSFEKYSSASEKYLSPSALNSYINCRLRFYFSYVAGLRELDTVSEEIEADTFGNLLHETMHGNYREYEGKTINSTDFDNLLDEAHMKTVLDNAFRKEYYKSEDPEQEVVPEGRNIIVYEVLKKYMIQILEIDKKTAPFQIISLEKEYKSLVNGGEGKSGFEIRLGGKIDRVDKKDGIFRIIDYKTGKAELDFNSIEKLFDRSYEKRNNPAFQTLLYSWLFSKESEATFINPGLYITRKLFQEDFDPMVTMAKKVFNFQENKEEFETRLLGILAEIWDTSVPFDQTEILENCEYCPYADICHRKIEKKF
jgi:CRISPR/Cas system-associated exonuclease Cas4 (RecB family)